MKRLTFHSNFNSTMLSYFIDRSGQNIRLISSSHLNKYRDIFWIINIIRFFIINKLYLRIFCEIDICSNEMKNKMDNNEPCMILKRVKRLQYVSISVYM